MYLLDFSKLDFDEFVIKQFKVEDPYSPAKVFKNVLIAGAIVLYQPGADISTQRQYSSIANLFEKELKKDPAGKFCLELCDDDYEFIKNVFNETLLPLSPAFVQVVEFFEKSEKLKF